VHRKVGGGESGGAGEAAPLHIVRKVVGGEGGGDGTKGSLKRGGKTKQRSRLRPGRGGRRGERDRCCSKMESEEGNWKGDVCYEQSARGGKKKIQGKRGGNYRGVVLEERGGNNYCGNGG